MTTPRLFYPNLDALLASYDLSTDQRQAVTEAYETFRDHHAPFMVSIAAQMLPDLREEVTANPGRRIAFLGRDGHSLAAGVRTLAPDFFAQHCSELVLSRKVVDAVLQDLETNAGMTFPQLTPHVFREKSHEVPAADIPGAFRKLTQYLQRSGLPVGVPGSQLTVVDTSFKGSVQEALAAMYPATSFYGRYAFFGESPDDPHPGTKRGYVVHQEVGQDWEGVILVDLPENPALTFTAREAIQTIEYTQHGPFGSPTGWAPQGLHQSGQRNEPHPLAELNPIMISAQYNDPVVWEAVKASALLAIHDTAADAVADRNAGRDWIGPLMSARDRYTHAVRDWIQRRPLSDPRLQRLLDSFVPRRDRKLNVRFTALLRDARVPPRQANDLWRQLAAIHPLADKETLVEQTAARLQSTANAHSASVLAKLAFPGSTRDRLNRPGGGTGTPRSQEPPTRPEPGRDTPER
jgi:hypothetical protein